MRSVLERIHRDYPQGEHILEINVLDGSGDNFLVFSGELKDLTDTHFTKVLRNARCFYLFTVLGIEKHLVESMDLHQHHIRRQEFAWLTPPEAPEILNSSDWSAVIKWKDVLYCGFSPREVENKNIKYIVEIPEGHESKHVGLASRYATDTTARHHHSHLR